MWRNQNLPIILNIKQTIQKETGIIELQFNTRLLTARLKNPTGLNVNFVLSFPFINNRIHRHGSQSRKCLNVSYQTMSLC